MNKKTILVLLLANPRVDGSNQSRVSMVLSSPKGTYKNDIITRTSWAEQRTLEISSEFSSYFPLRTL